MASSAEELTPHFMRLPLELRRQIYQCLLPDRSIDSLPYPRKREPRLRRDHNPCHCAILRVNHKIHQETMEVLYHDQLFGVRVRTRPTHHDLFLCRDMTPEDSLRLYLPRIRRLRVAIEEPQLISGTRDGRERLYTFKDKIRRLCSYLVNAHSLHELIIWSRVPLPLWHKTTFGKRPLPISDTYHVLELFGRLRNVQHVSLQDYEGVSFNEAADEKMKDVLLLMAGQSPRSAPHPVEALWDALPSFTAKLTGINVDDEVWLARCSRENRDLPGFEKAIQQMVDKEMARRKEVDRALAELYSVQQGGMKT